MSDQQQQEDAAFELGYETWNKDFTHIPENIVETSQLFHMDEYWQGIAKAKAEYKERQMLALLTGEHNEL